MQNRNSIIILGNGGHAKSCIDVIESSGSFYPAGIVVEDTMSLGEFMGYPIVGRDSDLPAIAHQFPRILIGVGMIKSSKLRRNIFYKLMGLGFQLPTVCSGEAKVSVHARLSPGCIIMHQSFINADASIGDNCIINSGAIIEHDVTIGNHSHIAPRATINGGVSVGEGSFVGAGAIVKQGVTIGDGVLVAMGSVVTRDIPDNATFGMNK